MKAARGCESGACGKRGEGPPGRRGAVPKSVWLAEVLETYRACRSPCPPPRSGYAMKETPMGNHDGEFEGFAYDPKQGPTSRAPLPLSPSNPD
jgi:hypothetical protein